MTKTELHLNRIDTLISGVQAKLETISNARKDESNNVAWLNGQYCAYVTMLDLLRVEQTQICKEIDSEQI